MYAKLKNEKLLFIKSNMSPLNEKIVTIGDARLRNSALLKPCTFVYSWQNDMHAYAALEVIFKSK